MSDFFEEYYILRNKIYDALDTIYNTNLNDECLLEYKKEEVNSLFLRIYFYVVSISIVWILSIEDL